MFNRVTSVVQTDLMTNFAAAMLVMMMSANFTPQIDFPFKLINVGENSEMVSGAGKIEETKITIFIKNAKLMIKCNDRTIPFENIQKGGFIINTLLPCRIFVEDNSGFSIAQLMTLMNYLRGKGIDNVALVTEAMGPG